MLKCLRDKEMKFFRIPIRSKIVLARFMLSGVVEY